MMTQQNQALMGTYFKAVADIGCKRSLQGFRFYVNYLFGDVNLAGKRMLDVGAGTGLYGYYAACCGARQVTCLEPEMAGAVDSVGGKRRVFSDRLHLGQVEFLPIPIQEFDADDGAYDIVLLQDSVNHLDEEAVVTLSDSEEARRTYVSIFRKIYSLMSGGGLLILTDCARANFFPLCGLRNPFVPDIEWPKHQPPEMWTRLLAEVGFLAPQVSWPFNRLGTVGNAIFGNRVGQYFFNSHFVLKMGKSGESLYPERKA